MVQMAQDGSMDEPGKCNLLTFINEKQSQSPFYNWPQNGKLHRSPIKAPWSLCSKKHGPENGGSQQANNAHSFVFAHGNLWSTLLAIEETRSLSRNCKNRSFIRNSGTSAWLLAISVSDANSVSDKLPESAETPSRGHKRHFACW